MSWTVVLEDENREKLASISAEFEIDVTIDLSEFILLRYLDPYGDTIFNRCQIEDLTRDLVRLNSLSQNPLLEEIRALAEQCNKGVHTYLVFYGD